MALIYRVAKTLAQRDEPYLRMRDEGLLACAMSAFAKPALSDWRRITAPGKGFLLCCEDQSGQLLGCGLFTRQPYRVWQFDFTAFRAGFAVAAEQARGGFQWAFDHLDCTSIMGVCPLPNRHAWRLASACGFRVLARLPEACFYARKGKYVDGVLVLCTPENLKEVSMSLGGGTPDYSAPAPTPKAEVTKPVTEAATAARDAQKKRASKAAGLQSTILTGSPLDNGGTSGGKTLLGQ